MRLAAAVCALASAAALARGQDVPVFSSSIDLVRLDVSVTRDGEPIKGLTTRDFEVKDNGVLQDVELVGGDEKKVHAVLALDTSSSLDGPPLAHLKTAAHALVDVLHADDALSLLTFSDRIELRASPDEPRERAHALIEATQAQLTTSLGDASFAALTMADPTRGRPLVLIFSDGQDVGSWLTPEQVLLVARSSELVVHVVVSWREGTQMDFLRELTSVTGGDLWHAEHRELKDVLLRALEEFRNRYTLQYAASGEARAGWHKIDVRLRHGAGTIRARKGYWRLTARP
jgi:VWFA-related protein